MNFKQTIAIEVNGKLVHATVTVEAPGLDVDEDCVNAQMILSTAAAGRTMTYSSRHHKDRNATIRVLPPVEAVVQPLLRRVA